MDKKIGVFLCSLFIATLVTMDDVVGKNKTGQPQKTSLKEYPIFEWDMLIPKSEKLYPKPPARAIDHSGIGQVAQEKGHIRTELDHQKIKIPGYAVPLQGDDKKITEFLLVPYMGACVHMPPPATNQIILVRYPKGAPTDLLYDAIWVSGTLKTIEKKHLSGIISGYSLDSVAVDEYIHL